VSLVPHLVNGVALGLLFALIALGFMLIVSVMETINLAHGSFFALGMYVALVVMSPGDGTSAMNRSMAAACCARSRMAGGASSGFSATRAISSLAMAWKRGALAWD